MMMEAFSWFLLLVPVFCFGQDQFHCTRKRQFILNYFFTNRVIIEESLWSESGVGSLMACSSDCFHDGDCVSFFYNTESDVCIAHSARLRSLDGSVTEEGSLYYTLDRRDCGEILRRHPEAADGMYLISPDNPGGPVEVYCDMTTDGVGWTVFQRRQDSSVNFWRNWEQYKIGFGDRKGNFWLGNDLLNRMTTTGTAQLRIDMLDYNDESGFATYSTFRVEDEVEGYRLTLSGFKGNRGDSMAIHNGMKFSTKDRDNDEIDFNCAEAYVGAWWYKACHSSNLNGLYGKDKGDIGICWGQRYGDFPNLKWTEMKFRFSE